MKNKFRRVLAFLLCAACMGFVKISAYDSTKSALREDIQAAASGAVLEISCESACLMEASTGEILYEQNSDERLEPASVTKIMSLLLITEAIDNGDIKLDDGVAGSAHAASMGGSQIWLEVGETLSVNDMLKAIAVTSANDCTVAMAEHLAGSEETFVARMNERAQQLGMENTHFSNCTGLPVENHYTTAHDIAIMTRELLKHEIIFDYTTIWTDTLRNGAMGLANTNKLIRFYNGANGMKTGFTSSALYCLSATAKRGDMQLIATVMKGPTSDKRFQDAKKLLDYGFANFCLYTPEINIAKTLPVTCGTKQSVKIKCENKPLLLPKGTEKNVESNAVIEEKLAAPVTKGQKVGHVSYSVGGKEIARIPVTASGNVAKLSFSDILSRLIKESVSVR